MKSKLNPHMGSRSEANPLKAVKWLWRPKPSSKTLNNLEILRASCPTFPFSTGLIEVKVTQAVTGEMTEERHGVIRLSFDLGINNEIGGIAQTLTDRYGNKPKTPQRMGIGGQLAYEYYLNFFSPYSYFTFQLDRFQGSRKPKPYDVLIGKIIDGDAEKDFFTIEVKTSPHGSGTLNYYQPLNTAYADYCVAIRCLNEKMTKYELFGYTLGSNVKQHKFVFRDGKRCHPMTLNRKNFDYYSYFHKNILGLPFESWFSDSQSRRLM